jgi:hypothetical protein
MRHRLIFRSIHDEAGFSPTIIYIFRDLSDDDRILNLLVDMHCHERSVAAGVEDPENDLHRSFMSRAMRTYAAWRDSEGKVRLPKYCDCHDHTTAEEMQECRAQVEKQLSE